MKKSVRTRAHGLDLDGITGISQDALEFRGLMMKSCNHEHQLMIMIWYMKSRNYGNFMIWYMTSSEYFIWTLILHICMKIAWMESCITWNRVDDLIGVWGWGHPPTGFVPEAREGGSDWGFCPLYVTMSVRTAKTQKWKLRGFLILLKLTLLRFERHNAKVWNPAEHEKYL